MTVPGLDPPDLILSLDEPDAATASRVGPKAAALARLRRAGLPVPDGFCVAAEAYRAQLAVAGVAETSRQVAGVPEAAAGRLALAVRLGLLEAPLPTALAEGLDAAYRQLSREADLPVAVRSSALQEGTVVTSYAGQLETLLGVGGPAGLPTAVRACWASPWSPRAVRYMRACHGDPARVAVAVLVQRLVLARVAGGALSETAEGPLVLTAAWGLGPAVAQGMVVPDRYVLRRDGPVIEGVEPGRKDRALRYCQEAGPHWQAVPPRRVAAPCLSEAEALALARLVLRAEAVLGHPLEVEWALDDHGFQILQARPVTVRPRRAAHRRWRGDPALRGQPAGSGLAVGPARVVLAEAEVDRVEPGEVLVTRVPGPALAAVLPRVAGVVTELGGSTSHLAALARERGLPAVLGVRGVTRRIRDGSLVLVDGVEGVVCPLGPGVADEAGLGIPGRAESPMEPGEGGIGRSGEGMSPPPPAREVRWPRLP